MPNILNHLFRQASPAGEISSNPFVTLVQLRDFFVYLS